MARKMAKKIEEEPWDKEKFMVWTWNDPDDVDKGGFWSQFDSFDDAVKCNEGDVEVFSFKPKFIGLHKRCSNCGSIINIELCIESGCNSHGLS